MGKPHPLRRWREHRELSQDEAGSLIGVPANTFARWERGETIPQRRYREKIASVAGIPEGKILAAFASEAA